MSPLPSIEDGHMISNITSEPDKLEPGLQRGALQSILAQGGEIEIAGRRYARANRLAAVLGVTERTLSRWHAKRIGPPKITIGKTVLFDLGKLPDWLASREAQPLARNTHH
jgi:hypothetical protein